MKKFVKPILTRIQNWEKEATLREKILLFVFSVLLPIFLFYKFIYSPKMEYINALNEQVAELKLKLKRYQKLSSQLKSLKKKYEKRKKFLEEIQKMLPQEKEIASLLKAIADLSTRNFLTIEYFKPGKERNYKYYDAIPIYLNFEGTYYNILNFLKELGDYRRIIVISRIEFRPEPNFKKIKVRATLYVYKNKPY